MWKPVGLLRLQYQFWKRGVGVREDEEVNGMDDGYEIAEGPTLRLRRAPRCTARAKATGQPRRNPSKRGWNVCRMHGAGGGAPPGEAHPNYTHGLRTAEMKALKLLVGRLCRG